MKQSNKIKVKCMGCGYTWETKSLLGAVTCPSCQNKTPIKENKKEKKE